MLYQRMNKLRNTCHILKIRVYYCTAHGKLVMLTYLERSTSATLH